MQPAQWETTADPAAKSGGSWAAVPVTSPKKRHPVWRKGAGRKPPNPSNPSAPRSLSLGQTGSPVSSPDPPPGLRNRSPPLCNPVLSITSHRRAASSRKGSRDVLVPAPVPPLTTSAPQFPHQQTAGTHCTGVTRVPLSVCSLLCDTLLHSRWAPQGCSPVHHLFLGQSLGTENPELRGPLQLRIC